MPRFGQETFNSTIRFESHLEYFLKLVCFSLNKYGFLYILVDSGESGAAVIWYLTVRISNWMQIGLLWDV